MGCFLACFGLSKNKRRRKHTPVSSYSPARSPKVEGSDKTVQQNLAPKQAKLDESIIVVPESPVKQEKQPSAAIPKKVTFVSTVPIHNPVSDSENKATVDSPGRKQSDDEKVLVNGSSIAEQISLLPASESGNSTLSSLGSYPPNHRYHNCRESDNEDEMECEEEIDVDDYDVYKDAADEEDSLNSNQEWTPGSFSSMESRTKSSTACLSMRNLDGMIDDATKDFNCDDRYASVLGPVENLSQMKDVKPKVELPLEQKENSSTAEERQLLVKSQFNLDDGEQAIDASLSSWIVSSQKTPATKTTARGLETIPSETSASSHGSNSVRSFNDRPILGALTMKELKQISASESPRRSPSHSADDRPIIGSVGSHWSEKTPSVESGSASSFKGIPNTTSKYREDKRVKWHSTPFETRLEQALKKGASGVPF